MQLTTRFISLFFITLILTLISSPTFAGHAHHASASKAQITWHDWSDQTFALAASENKLILLDVSAQWCQFCKKMKAVTYQDPEVVKIINDNYIAIFADIEATPVVGKRYAQLGVPGTVILTADKKELNKRRGYIAPQQMQWHLLGNLQDASMETASKDKH
ncbi:thioredoxin family protein [sulfur-oxidizing endosymbiont of Gigantopelta aegis]|uniref:thioredoxin family protein n=1 Tax=sulfur-oxidizing endosymbiont of Gigantopelta aegis TaxID=2794934 RepID=UPI0018DBBA52|nr:DUF255 domain-containing protein [sulfur-oxidizing endosymbiont of Gigantopelta aegis]